LPYSSSPTNTHRKTIDAARSTSYRDHAAGRLLSEDGPWANNTVTYGCTAPMRTTLSLQSPNADPWNQSYGYDAAYRLTATASPARSFACEYDYPRKLNAGNSDLPDTSDITRFYGTATGPLSTQLETSGGSTLDPYWYDFDVSNQETRITHAAGNLIAYDYDAKGRLTSMRVFNNCFAGTFTFVHDGWNSLAGITYAYGPFGEVIRATGPMAKLDPFRFSTKYQDDESDLLYYGYRYLNTSTGRWLSRDPILENAFEMTFEPVEGFVDNAEDANEYLFVHNNALTKYDILGLCVTVKSGPGTVSGNTLTVNFHHPLGLFYTSYPPASDTFTLKCPSDRPYLMTWGLSASPYSPVPFNHPFPGGWSLMSMSPGPGTYTIVITVPSSTIVHADPSLGGVFVQGCCTCSPYSIQRQDPPAPPQAPPKPYHH
jgi:RHS repeat-associated protein